MKKYEFIGKIVNYERKNNSIYGNPKYTALFADDNLNILKATTASNAACAYKFLNCPESMRKITYHITQKGNNVIDYIEIIK